MFLDGIQKCKKSNDKSSLSQRISQSNSIQVSKLLKSKVVDKLSDIQIGLKDELTKSFARLLVAEGDSKTGANNGNRRASPKSCKASLGNDNHICNGVRSRSYHLSTSKRLNNQCSNLVTKINQLQVSCKRSNAYLALGGIVDGGCDAKAAPAEPLTSGLYAKQRNRLSKLSNQYNQRQQTSAESLASSAQVKWASALRASSPRSMSLKFMPPSSHAAPADCTAQQRRQQFKTNKKHTSSHSLVGGSEIALCNGICLLSSRRCSFTGVRRNTLSANVLSNILLITLTTLGAIRQPAATVAQAAPLVPLANVRPIWLHDGLITLDPNSLEPEVAADDQLQQQQLKEAATAGLLEQNLARLAALQEHDDVSEQEQQRRAYRQPNSNQFGQPLHELNLPHVAQYDDNNSEEYRQRQQRQINLPRGEGATIDDASQLRINVVAKPEVENDQELFWIQRRRLERDRALEPPPWLRQRPMRRGFNPALLARLRDGNGEPNSVQSGNSEAAQRVVTADGQWFRPVRGRQSRQSAEQAYEEILRHLLDEARDSRSLLEELYDELELRLKANKMPGAVGVSGGQQYSSAAKSEQLQQQQQQQQLQQHQQAALAASSMLADSGGAQQMLSEPGAVSPQESRPLDEASQQEAVVDPDSTLLLVRDDVSSGDEDDISAPNNWRSLMSSAYTQQQSGEQVGSGAPVINLASNPYASISISGDSAATVAIPLQLTGADLSKDSSVGRVYSHQPELTNQPNAPLAIGMPLPNSNMAQQQQPKQQQQQQQQQQQIPPQLNSFHVLEDIDRADDSTQDTDIIMSQVMTPTHLDNKNNGNSDNSGNGAGEEGRFQQQLLAVQSPEQEVAAGDWFSAPPSEVNRAEMKRAYISELFGSRQMLPSPLGGQPMKRNNVQRTNIAATIDQSTLAPPKAARDIDVATATFQRSMQRPNDSLNVGGINDLTAAVQMIEAGYLNKEQLVGAATSLKTHLEIMVKIPRDSILGLYPINQEQLLIKLDTSKLNAYQMMNLVKNYEFARGFIVVSWPKGSRQSPLPVLAAILRLLALKSTETGAAAIEGTNASGFQENSKSYADSDKNVVSGSIDRADDDDVADDTNGDVNFTDQDLDKLTLVESAAKAATTQQQRQQQWQPASLRHYRYPYQNRQQPARQSVDDPSLPVSQSYAFGRGQRQQQWLEQRQQQHRQFGLLAHQLASEQADNGRYSQRLLQSMGAPSDRLSLALLSAYLKVPYHGDQVVKVWPTDGQLLDSSLILDGVGGGGEFGQMDSAPLLPSAKRLSGGDLSVADGSQQTNNDSRYSWFHPLHLVGLVAVAVGACVVAKLLLIGASKNQSALRRRFARGSATDSLCSLLSSSISTTRSQTIVGPAGKSVDLESAGGSLARRLSAESGQSVEPSACCESAYESGSCGHGKSATNFDLLTQRLYSLLIHRTSGGTQTDGVAKKADESVDCTAAITEKDKCQEKQDENRQIEELEEDSISTASGQTRFRTSRSYIKSLIEVLAKARSQIPSSLVGQRSIDDDEFEQSAAFLAKSSSSSSSANHSTNSATAGEQQVAVSDASNTQQLAGELDGDQNPGIIMSQMDISAAHLILAYMEKHLEDKERLRREWLELNAGSIGLSVGVGSSQQQQQQQQQRSSASAQREPRSPSTGNKISQLMLQRLAKVATSDENRPKNWNCLVVPFDRNRVKLGPQVLTPLQAAAAAKPAAASGQQQRRQTEKTGKVGAAQRSSDYINASYIYDDDPRRPTHIIAQGPSEQTIGQFWQMVWEQGISVIVMLTRLNENSTRMCHCYWPTNANAGPPGTEVESSTSLVQEAATLTVANGSKQQPLMGAAGTSTASLPTAANAESATVSNATASTTGNEAPAASSSPPPLAAAATAANGRRGSVTSVFNAAAARHSGVANRPIVANVDLTNNILYFDVVSSAQRSPSLSATSLDEEPATSPRDGQTKTAATSKAKTTSTTTSNKQQQQVVRFEVHLVSEHVSSKDFLVRNMYMINRSTGETRTITQFHYLAWPEAGVPENVRSLLQFRRKVHQSYRNLKSPILVHCSDGAGRSGTYTLIDIILERIKKGAKEIDPRATLEHLRDQRIGLCATQSQFQFVLMALAEEIQIILNALPQ